MVIETPFLLVLLLRRVVMIIRPLELLDPSGLLWVSTAAMCSNLENSLSRNTAPAQTDDLTPPPPPQVRILETPYFSYVPKVPRLPVFRDFRVR